jgi:hypothetical protein
MEVHDEAVNILDQIYIKDSLLGVDFSWYFKNDVTEINGYQNRPGFCHNFMLEGKINSPYFEIVKLLVKLAERATDKKFERVLHARSFCQLPLSEALVNHNVLDQYHIDREEPHWVILYYVNDYDGETIISDSCFDYTGNNIIDTKTHQFNIIKRVEGKQGRMLFFNGKHYHTATQPKEKYKCVININVA